MGRPAPPKLESQGWEGLGLCGEGRAGRRLGGSSEALVGGLQLWRWNRAEASDGWPGLSHLVGRTHLMLTDLL